MWSISSHYFQVALHYCCWNHWHCFDLKAVHILFLVSFLFQDSLTLFFYKYKKEANLNLRTISYHIFDWSMLFVLLIFFFEVFFRIQRPHIEKLFMLLRLVNEMYILRKINKNLSWWELKNILENLNQNKVFFFN